jgi:Spy/CpxP family protein refolding chaperone
MKKLIVTTMLLTSMVAFSENVSMPVKTGMMQQLNMNMGTGMMQQIDKLTPEQKIQMEKINLEYQKKNQEYLFRIKQIDLKIETEMLDEKIDTKKIGSLIDKKVSLQSRIQKNMINYRIDIKKKFGINVMHGMMQGSHNNMNMNQMMNDMNQMQIKKQEPDLKK